MFLPLGEDLAAQVLTTSGLIYQAMYLLEVCDFLLSMAWPTTISYADFSSSIRGLKTGYSNFLTVLSTLQPQLTGWFHAVNKHPASFAIASLPYLAIHNRGFPALNTGDFPKTILDSHVGNGQRLYLATHQQCLHDYWFEGSAEGLLDFRADSYFGAVIPGCLCANFAYHSAVVARWPTQIDPLADLILPPFVSERALDFEPMMIDLYSNHHPQLHLITKDAQSTEDHRRQTPKHS
jgi:hypothetical protein